jgi:hypothetical protein
MTKVLSTARICATLFMARTFGRYMFSGWNGDCDFAVYRWRGENWMIPTGPIWRV